MKKRLFASILCTIMAMSALSGCGTKEQTPAESRLPSEGATSEADGEQAKKFDDVRLNYLLCWNGGFQSLDNQYDNDVSKAIREKTGVTVEIEGIMMSEVDKLNMLFASGDMPDMINAPYWGGTEACTLLLKKAAKEGRLTDIKDKLENYPNIKDTYKEGIVSTKYLETDLDDPEFNGGRYILPWQLPANAENESNWGYGVFVRDDVAKALNVDPLTIKTQDQLWDFMEKAKVHGFKDVNGNDTIVASTHQAGSNYADYCLNLSQKKLTGYSMGSDGKVTLDTLTQDWVDQNMFIWKMVNEGFMDKECFKQSNERAIEKIGNATPLFVSMMYGWIVDATKQTGLYDAHPEMRYVPVGPLNYKDGSPAVQPTSEGRTGSPAIVFPTSCKNIDAALAWLDYINSEEGARLTSYGIEGDTYVLNDKGQPRMNDELSERYKTDSAAVTKELREKGVGYLAQWNICIDQKKTWWDESAPFTADGLSPEVKEYNDLRPVERISGYPISALEKGFDRFVDISEFAFEGTTSTDYAQRAFFAKTEEEARKILEDYQEYLRTQKGGLMSEFEKYMTEQANSRDDIVY